jgi:hypothetical protein
MALADPPRFDTLTPAMLPLKARTIPNENFDADMNQPAASLTTFSILDCDYLILQEQFCENL